MGLPCKDCLVLPLCRGRILKQLVDECDLIWDYYVTDAIKLSIFGKLDIMKESREPYFLEPFCYTDGVIEYEERK